MNRKDLAMAKSSREGKKMIALEMDESLYDAVKNLAFEQGQNTSSAIRMVLIDYLRRYKGYKPIKTRKDC